MRDWAVTLDEGDAEIGRSETHAGFTLTLEEREETLPWGDFGWFVVRPLNIDSNFDALALVLTDLDVDRVCITSEGSWCGRWMPARDAPGHEARLWVIELPGSGKGTLTLDDRAQTSISWP